MNNQYVDPKYLVKYFDRRIPEEDLPMQVSDDKQDLYEKLDQFFENIFDENSLNVAKQSSKEERDQKELNESSYVYGEVTFRSLSYIFEFVKEKYGSKSINTGNFIDLGSGIGRGVVAASMIHPFRNYIGVEFLENLHNIGLEIKEKYDEQLKEFSAEYPELIADFTKDQNIELICGDFLGMDWSEASFLFANSTCFSPELMDHLSKKAEELPIGAYFVTFTKKLPDLSEDWEVSNGFRRLMSWGIATVYVHRKIN